MGRLVLRKSMRPERLAPAGITGYRPFVRARLSRDQRSAGTHHVLVDSGASLSIASFSVGHVLGLTDDELRSGVHVRLGGFGSAANDTFGHEVDVALIIDGQAVAIGTQMIFFSTASLGGTAILFGQQTFLQSYRFVQTYHVAHGSKPEFRLIEHDRL